MELDDAVELDIPSNHEHEHHPPGHHHRHNGRGHRRRCGSGSWFGYGHKKVLSRWTNICIWMIVAMFALVPIIVLLTYLVCRALLKITLHHHGIATD